VDWRRSPEGTRAPNAERDKEVRARLDAVEDADRFRAMIARDVSASRAALGLGPIFDF
jgi:hypothetical protein